MGILGKLFGLGPKVNLDEWMANGAVIVDVRTPGEYKQGHIKGSVNIPLDSLSGGMKKLNKNKPVITCCASGMRSAAAKSQLAKAGFEVTNGGSWTALRKYSK